MPECSEAAKAHNTFVAKLTKKAVHISFVTGCNLGDDLGALDVMAQLVQLLDAIRWIK